jgi:hypothetical protein
MLCVSFFFQRPDGSVDNDQDAKNTRLPSLRILSLFAANLLRLAGSKA